MLADELQHKAEAFSNEVARVRAELLELRRQVTVYSDDIDRMTR